MRAEKLTHIFKELARSRPENSSAWTRGPDRRPGPAAAHHWPVAIAFRPSILANSPIQYTVKLSTAMGADDMIDSELSTNPEVTE